MSLEAFVTDIGKAKLAAAAAGGAAVVLAVGAVGDGNGEAYVPTPGMVDLVNEVWRDDLSSVGLDPQNASCLLVEIVVPIDTGGYWVREVGIFDGDGDLFAVAAFPETYKPPLAEGSGTSLDISIPIPVTDAAQVDLVVDATKVWVTLQAMQAALAEHDADPAAHGDLAAIFAAIDHTHGASYANCYLMKSGASLLLKRQGGKNLTIDGVTREIPEAGVSVAPTGLPVSDWGYVYAYWDGSDIVLECSQTEYVVDSSTGIPVMSGDASRTFVGMWMTDGASAFNGVASYFNRRLRSFLISLGTAFAITSSGWVAISPSSPIDALFFGDTPVVAAGYSSAFHASDLGYVGLALGQTSTDVSGQIVSANPKTSQIIPLSVGLSFTFSEGRNRIYLLGKSNSDTLAATYQGLVLVAHTMG